MADTIPLKQLNQDPAKGSNKFKFMSFSERVAGLKINVIHRVGKQADAPEEEDSFFQEAMTKWRELNCTQHFARFCADVTPHAQSFNQLLHNQERVLGIILDHLAVPNSMCIEPLLDLLTQLARDLRQEFYPYFRRTFDVLVRLLNDNAHDVETLQHTFVCLTYLFKFLTKYLVRDLAEVFSYYLNLFEDDQKPHVRQFAAESLSFLLRKVQPQDLPPLVDAMLACFQAHQSEAFVEAVGGLLFETLKGVAHQFHSRAPQTYALLMSRLHAPIKSGGKKLTGDEEKDVRDLVALALETLNTKMAEFTKKEHCGFVWEFLHKYAAELAAALGGGHSGDGELVSASTPGGAAEAALISTLDIARLWTRFKRGARVTDTSIVYKIVEPVVNVAPAGAKDAPKMSKKGKKAAANGDAAGGDTRFSLAAVTAAFALLEQVLRVETSERALSFGPRMVALCVFHPYAVSDPEIAVRVFRELHKCPVYPQLCLPLLTRYASAHFTGRPGDAAVLQYLANLADVIDLRASASASISKSGRLRYPDPETGAAFPERLVQYAGGLLKQDAGAETLALLYACLRTLRITELPNPKSALKLANDVMDTMRKLAGNSTQRMHATFIIGQAMELAVLLAAGDQKALDGLGNKMWGLAREFSDDASVLGGLAVYFDELTDGHELKGTARLDEFYPHVLDNLWSPSHNLRLQTLRALAAFTQHPLLPPANLTQEERRVYVPEPNPVFESLARAEAMPVTLADYRDILVHIKRASGFSTHGRMPEQYKETVLRYGLGLLYVNFKFIWEGAMGVLRLEAAHAPDDFWALFINRVRHAAALTHTTRPAHDPHADMAEETASLSSLGAEFASAAAPDTAKADHGHFYSLLMQTVYGGEQPVWVAVERHSRELVPVFLAFVDEEYRTAYIGASDTQSLTDSGAANDEDDDEAETETPAPRAEAVSASRRAVNRKLLDYLRVFSKFVNPKSLYMADRVRNFYLELLGKNDKDVQTEALRCLLTYKHGYLNVHKETLEALLDEDKFRDALAKFDIAEDGGQIAREHRPELLNVVVRILYAHMLRRKGMSSGKHSLHTRRNTVLAYLSALKSDELRVFLDFIIEPFRDLAAGGVGAGTIDVTRVVPLAKQAGFLNLILDVIKQLRTLLLPYMDSLLNVTLRIAYDATAILNMHREQIDQRHIAELRRLRLGGIKALTMFFSTYPTHDFTPILPALMDGVVAPRMASLRDESLQHSSGLLDLFATWSSHRALAALFSVGRAKEVLPLVFGLLSAATVSPAVVSRVHDIAEELLRLKDEEEAADADVAPRIAETVVRPHIRTLLKHMHAAILNAEATKGTDKRMRCSRRELSILSRISMYATDAETANQLLALLLPYLKQGPRMVSDDTKVHILDIVRECLRQVPTTPYHYSYLSQMFNTLTKRAQRIALCQAFEEVVEKDEALAGLQGLLPRLNAYDATLVDEPDYDVRLAAFAEVNETLVHQLSVRELVPIAFTYLFYAGSSDTDDMALKNSAAHGLVEIARRARGDMENGDHAADEELVTRIIVPGLKRALRSPREAVRHEFLGILDQLITLYPDGPFGTLAALRGADAESNFFENIRHIQQHRRVRALTRLAAFAADEATGMLEILKESATLAQPAIVHVLLPVVQHFVYECTKQSQHHMLQEAVLALGALALRMSWGHYLYTVRQLLRSITKKPDLEKNLLKAVVEVVNNFHFDARVEDSAHAPMDVDAKEAPGAAGDEALADESGDDDDDDDVDAQIVEIDPETQANKQAFARKVRESVLTSLMPEMYKYLTKKDSDGDVALRVPVAVAITRLLQALDEAALHKELPKLVVKVVVVLKSRDDDTRADARQTLLRMLKTLGSVYLPFVLKELQAELKFGYKLHILGYTVYEILSALTDDGLEPGALDESLSILLDIIVPDIFGLVGEEKEVVAILGKMKESKAKKGYDSFELVARNVSFQYITALLRPLRDLMEQSDSAKVARMLDDVFKRIALGLVVNPSASVEETLILVQALVTENFELSRRATKESVKKTLREETFAVQRDPRKEKSNADPVRNLQAHAHMFIEFGLSLLVTNLKRGRIEPSVREHLQMMDPLVGLLGDLLKSKYDKIVMLSLKALSFSFRLRLPALERAVPHIATRCYKLLLRAGIGSTSDEMHQACFKMLTTIIRDYPGYKVPDEHIKSIINVVRADLEAVDKQNSTYAMLRAVVARKVVLEEIYDVMELVSDLMVRSDVPSIRQLCGQILVSFLLNYPLGPKRLQKHLQFLVVNLDYEWQHGRESVLEILNRIVGEFPEAVLREYLQFMFVPLVMRLVNDDVATCREMAGSVIRSMVQRCDAQGRDKLFELTAVWMRSEAAALQRAGLQLLGLFVDVLGAAARQYVDKVLDIVCAHITRGAADQGGDEESGEVDDSQAWPVLYFSTVVLAKALAAIPDLHGTQETSAIWAHVHENLLHNHAWVRLSSARLMGVYFGSLDVAKLCAAMGGASVSKTPPNKKAKKSDAGAPLAGEYIVQPGHAFACAKSCVKQLESVYLTAPLATQVVKNLFFLTKLLVEMVRTGKASAAIGGESVAHAAANGNGPREAATDDEDEALEGEAETPHEASVEQTPVAWIVKKLAYIARNSRGSASLTALRRKAVFEYFATLTTLLGKEGILPMLPIVMSPIHRVLSVEADYGDADVKELASELSDMIKACVGATKYAEAFSRTQQLVANLRAERRKRRAFEAVVDPQKRQERRVKANVKRKMSKQRKIASYRPGSAKRVKLSRDN